MTNDTYDGLLPCGHMASGCRRTDYVASASSRSHMPAGSSLEYEYELIELKYELLYTKKRNIRHTARPNPFLSVHHTAVGLANYYLLRVLK